MQRLMILRWVEIAAQIAVLAIAVGPLRLPLPVAPMSAIIVSLTAVNLITWWRLRQAQTFSSGEILLNLAVDTAALAGLLYFAGGSTNPFVSLFLLPITIAVAMLPTRHAWPMAALTLGAYTLLMVINVPLPAPRGELARLDEWILRQTGIPPEHAAHFQSFGLHVLGMWFNFLMSAIIITLFVGRMASALRSRDVELARTREEVLRNEQILALGTLAAGAAHQLSTPLSTMAVVIGDLELEHAKDADLAADLRLLKQQIENCKKTLSDLLASAGHARSEGGTLCPFDRFIANIVDQWRLMRPEALLRTRIDGAGAVPLVLSDRTLEQAVLNLLANAADASPKGVDLLASWNDYEYRIEMLDQGPGLDAATASHVGRPFFTTKREKGGLGLGVFLSNATIERFGGQVELFNRSHAGACTRIRLPLANGTAS